MRPRHLACAGVLLLGAALAAAVTSIRMADIAGPAGLTMPNTFGGKDRKTYILESTGNGAAIFDYDGDGANDILIANGTTLQRPSGSPPVTVQLYRNRSEEHT